MSLKGKVALITGSAKGLGLGFAEAILKDGAKVCLSDIDARQGVQTLARLQKIFGNDNVIFVKCDVTDHQSLENVFKEAIKKFKRLDIVVNNAGVGLEDQVRRTIMINLIGVIDGTNLATQYLSKDNGGRGGVVVNVSSTAGLTPVFYMPVYTASKYGVVGYTRSVAQNPQNKERWMRYTCLCPGFTDTALFGEHQKVYHDASSIPGIDQVSIQGATDLISKTGVNTVEDVVKGFINLLVVEDNNGAVMTVTKKFGIQYRHGKPLSHKL